MAQTMKRPGADAPVINPPAARRAPWPVQFYRSAVGKKWVMAISGIMMLGFVVAHLIGNLKLTAGFNGLTGFNTIFGRNKYSPDTNRWLYELAAVTLLGVVEYERRHWKCDGCRREHAPLDLRLGMQVVL